MGRFGLVDVLSNDNGFFFFQYRKGDKVASQKS